MKNYLWTIVLAASVTSLVGCATQTPSGGGFNAIQLSTAQYGRKVDTFVIVQDASSSMSGKHMGRSKIDIAKETLSHMNQTIPHLDFNAGLVAFSGGCFNKAEVLYGLAPYDRDGLGGGIAKLTCASGLTPMDAGINHANSKLLTGLGLGQIAMFIVSDGISDSSHSSGGDGGKAGALEAAKKLKDQLGDRVCIYPIQIGNEPGGEEFMNKLAKIGGCGFASNAIEISSPKTVASYVIKTLLGPVAAAPAAAADTPPEKITLSADALFDFDKATLKSKGKRSLDSLMAKLGKVKYDVIVAIGYTDRIGSEDYNKQLSVRRANAVKGYLVSKGVDASNIFVDGKGEANPITGTTCVGKGMQTKALIACLQPDRRVEIEIAGLRK